MTCSRNSHGAGITDHGSFPFRAAHSADHEPSCVPRVAKDMRSLMLVVSALCVIGAKAATRSVHVTGTVANTQSWEITGYCTAMVVRSTELPDEGQSIQGEWYRYFGNEHLHAW